MDGKLFSHYVALVFWDVILPIHAYVSEETFIWNFLESELSTTFPASKPCGHANTLTRSEQEGHYPQPCVCNTTDPNEVLGCRLSWGNKTIPYLDFAMSASAVISQTFRLVNFPSQRHGAELTFNSPIVNVHGANFTLIDLDFKYSSFNAMLHLLYRLYFTNNAVRKLTFNNSVLTKADTLPENLGFKMVVSTLEEIVLVNVTSLYDASTSATRWNLDFSECDQLRKVSLLRTSATTKLACPILTLNYIELRSNRLENDHLDIYFDRQDGSNKTVIWKQQLMSDSDSGLAFYPRIFASPASSDSFTSAVFLPSHGGPDYFWKEATIHAGFVNKVCIPESVNRIEYGSLGNSSNLFVDELCVCGPEICDKPHVFNNQTKKLWLNRNCVQLSSAMCEICLMHQSGLHKIKDNVSLICSGELLDFTPITKCYWQAAGGVPNMIEQKYLPLAHLSIDSYALTHAYCRPNDIILPSLFSDHFIPTTIASIYDILEIPEGSLKQVKDKGVHAEFAPLRPQKKRPKIKASNLEDIFESEEPSMAVEKTSTVFIIWNFVFALITKA